MGAVKKLTRKAVYPFAFTFLICKVLGRTLHETWKHRDRGKGQFGEEVLKQLYFTGAQGLGLILTFSLIIGCGVGFEISLFLAEVGHQELLNRMFFLLAVRELSPLLTAVVILARTGSSICSEFSSNVANGELQTLKSMGISVHRLLIFPRLVGVVFSTLFLSVLFAAVTMISGAFVLHIQTGVSFSECLFGILSVGSLKGINLFFVQNLLNGAWIAMVCSVLGLQIQPSTTEIPRAVSRAMVYCLLGLLLISFAKGLLLIL